MQKIHKLTYWILLVIGTHVGHSIFNSHFFTTWTGYLCIKFYNIIFINLFKSVILARTGFLTLAAVCQEFGPVWFVDLDPINKNYSKYAALKCGEFSWQGRWATGIISNYYTFGPIIGYLRFKPRVWHNARQKWFVGDLEYWLHSRISWPRYLFTQSVHTSYPPVVEAFFLGIPCFGVLDTNSYSNTVSIPFPGNDDSLSCIAFYNDLMVSYILYKKLYVIILWYYNIFLEDSEKPKIKKIITHKRKDESWNLPVFQDFHVHETFEISGKSEYIVKFPNNNYDSSYFKLKFWKLHVKLFKNLILYNNFFFENYVVTSYRSILLNRFYHRRVWLDKFSRVSSRADSYNIYKKKLRKYKYKISTPVFYFNDSEFGNKYLTYYISKRNSEYKDKPSFNISVNGGHYFYFTKTSEWLGFPRFKSKISNFKYHMYFDKWSIGNLFYKSHERKSKDILVYARYKFYLSLKDYTWGHKFFKFFDYTSSTLFNFNYWIKYEKKEYAKVLDALEYIIGSCFYTLDIYRATMNKLMLKYICCKKKEDREIFMVNSELLLIIKYFGYIIKTQMYEGINLTDKKKINDFFNIKINKEKIKIKKIKRLKNKYVPGITEGISRVKNIFYKFSTLFTYKYRYLGRRFIKKYFKFWWWKRGHKAWFFGRNHKWKRFYSTFYRLWYKRRLMKQCRFRNKFSKIFPIYIHKLLSLSYLIKSNKIDKSFKGLMMKNRMYYIKLLKRLVIMFKQNISFFKDNYRYREFQEYDQKELLLVIFFLDRIKNHKKESILFKQNLKYFFYQNSLLITNKIKELNITASSSLATGLMNLIHESKGSSVWATWREFSIATDKKKAQAKHSKMMEDICYIFSYPHKYNINIKQMAKYRHISSLYSWRYTKLIK